MGRMLMLRRLWRDGGRFFNCSQCKRSLLVQTAQRCSQRGVAHSAELLTAR